MEIINPNTGGMVRAAAADPEGFWAEAGRLVAPDRVGNLLRLLGGQDCDAVLAVLATYHQRASGWLSGVLHSPEVAAAFNYWRG